jgi:hypothetical protein
MRWRDVEAAAKLVRLQLQPWKVRRVRDIEAAFSNAARSRPDAMLVLSDPVLLERHRSLIVKLTDEHQLPATYPWNIC